MLTCKITLPDSPHLVIISVKIPDFGHFNSLDGKNSVFSFMKYKKMSFVYFWLMIVLIVFIFSLLTYYQRPNFVGYIIDAAAADDLLIRCSCSGLTENGGPKNTGPQQEKNTNN